MAVEYISYIQTENLFKAWPTIQGIKESLGRELSFYKYTDKMGSADDYIYTKVIGNKVLSDTPPSGKISDSTGNTAVNIENMWNEDMQSIKKRLMEEKFCIDLVNDKLEIAYRRLSLIQQKILKLFYLDNKTWAEVLEELKVEKYFLSKQQAQLQRRNGIYKIQSISKITVETYVSVIKLVEVE
ncbi:hypothetical protein ACR77J_12190 [Tissierella praeacuta]|uniref:hypothetical protein n=1 Tax=Tissierella praeacuta TaxID=43131 RepID=UPI001049A24F|nr:hypothetical protein [Tissierella praeacuta]TCU72886.1 hypothetical protein EV204_105222 [Tissierella praeacuta]